MYFLKNESSGGGDCLCTSGTYDSDLPTEKYSLMMATPARYKLSSTNRPYKQASAYLKQNPDSYSQPASYRQPAACSLPAVQPASYRQPAACSLPAVQPASYRQSAASKMFRPMQAPRRVAMLREPVSSLRRSANYEDTESSRPFDLEVDYGNAYGGVINENGIDVRTISSTDDIFFNPGTIDQTSAQYKEALRLYYDKLGYPNFTPKNGYDYGVEYFNYNAQSVPSKSYGTISKF